MTINEKIQYENGEWVHLWKEGVFWVAYEQSAYLVSQVKKLKPTRKYVKAAGMEVVSVGFPGSVLEGIVSPPVETGHALSLQITERTETHLILQSTQQIDNEEFVVWKNGIGIESGVYRNEARPVSALSSGVLDQIRNFDLSNATPIACMMFLSEIKKKI